MSDERANDVPAANNDMILGEMRGQLREVVHGQNNIAQKVEALTREVIGLGSLAVDVAEQKLANSALAMRVDALEAQQSRREGAQGVLQTILKSPALGWLAGAALTVWVLLFGKDGV